MNQSGRISIPLGYQLGIAIAFAVFIPVLLLGLTSYSSATQIGLNNLEVIVTESGARRQEAIENDFRTALTVLSDFALSPVNQSLFTAPIIERDRIGVSSNLFELEQGARAAIRTELLSTGWVNSVWLVENDDPQPFSIEAIADAVVPVSTFTGDINRSVLETAQTLAEREGVQTLLVVEGETNQHLFYLAPIYNRTADNEHVGTLVADFNLETLFLNNLAISESFETVSFVLWPNNQLIAPEETAPSVDLNSAGVQRVLATDVTNVIEYSVQRGDVATEVFGYFATIQLLNLPFKFVTEIETSVIPSQLNQSAASIGFAILLGGAVLTIITAVLLNQLIVPPLLSLREAMRAVGRGEFDKAVDGASRQDEIGGLASGFLEMRSQVQTFQTESNQRVERLTRDVRLTQDIARTFTAERDLQLLMDTVVNQIETNFPAIYHAQIFLVDANEEYALLRASTGEAGRELLRRGHRLAVGSVSVIGQVTEQNQLVIARDASESDVHRRNDLLQETRAELALPLTIEGRVIGALDVQSRRRDSFDDDQVQALRTLADQVTIAIENARLYEETTRLLQGIERERQATTRRSWRQFALQQREDVLTTQSGNKTDYDFDDLRAIVQQTGQYAIGEETAHETIPFAVPIVLRDVTLGVVTYELRKSDFSRDKVLLAQELVNRLAISLDNARLFRESQQAAARERLVNDISARLTQHNNVHDIIETAIREVSDVLQTPQVAVRFNLNGANGTQAPSVPAKDYQPADETI